MSRRTGLTGRPTAAEPAGLGPVSPALREVIAATARGLVEAQSALDRHAREGLLSWRDGDPPPSAFVWSSCRLAAPVALRCRERGGGDRQAELTLAPRRRAAGQLRLTLRYRAAPPGEPAAWPGDGPAGPPPADD